VGRIRLYREEVGAFSADPSPRSCLSAPVDSVPFKPSIDLLTVSVFPSNFPTPYVSIRCRMKFDQAPPKLDLTSAVVRCIVFLPISLICIHIDVTYPLGPALRSPPSMMCINFRWFKFPCCDCSFGWLLYSLSSSGASTLSPHPGGSTTLSSSTQASSPRPPLELVVGKKRCDHFGMIPRFSMSRVV